MFRLRPRASPALPTRFFEKRGNLFRLQSLALLGGTRKAGCRHTWTTQTTGIAAIFRSPSAQYRQGRQTIGLDRTLLPYPPIELLENASVFLDLDGTLLELVDRPEEVKADAELRELLVVLAAKLQGRLAVVSGRSLDQIDAILGEIASEMAVSGSHGCEHRWQGGLARPNRPETLDRAAERISSFVDRHSGLVLEEKSFGVALHYRMKPEAEAAARLLARELAEELGLHLQYGKMMVELRVAGGDKGRAVHRLMSRPPMEGTRPVFIGDDVTDEPGFEAARELKGHAILVGQRKPSAANYGIACPADLRGWLLAAALR